jgi:four helix bundle protein
MLKSYKDLQVWQKSYGQCLSVYKTTRNFPQEEKYVLVSQMRRSSISIPSNIAEGYGRKTTPEYIHSLYIAYGSNCELETQFLLARDLNYISGRDGEMLQKGVEEIERMLKALSGPWKRST